MKLSKLLLYASVLCLLAGYSAIAQDRSSVLLQDLLTELEGRFDVRFSYDPTLVRDLSIDEPENLDSLEEYLLQLSRLTPFEFRRINERYISLVEKKQYRSGLCATVIDGNESIAATVKAYTEISGLRLLKKPRDAEKVAACAFAVLRDVKNGNSGTLPF